VAYRGLTPGLLVTDPFEYSKHLSPKSSTISRYNNLSNVSVFTLIGGAGGMWLLSHATRNDHWRETGLLAGEAPLNSFRGGRRIKVSLGTSTGRFKGMAAGTFSKVVTSFPRNMPLPPGRLPGSLRMNTPGSSPSCSVYGLAATVDFSRVRGPPAFSLGRVRRQRDRQSRRTKHLQPPS